MAFARRQARDPRTLAVAGAAAAAAGIAAIVIQLVAGGGAQASRPGGADSRGSGAARSLITAYPRVEVPSLGISLAIVAGDGGSPPAVAEAFTYPGADHLLTGSHGGGGNTYLYAHSRNGMFLALHRVALGALVIIDFGHGDTLRYRVAAIHTSVDARDLSYVRQTADDRLTLQTCDGWRDLDPRFIVIAERDHPA